MRDPEILTAKEVADMLGVSLHLVYRATRTGILPRLPITQGRGRYLYSREMVLESLKSKAWESFRRKDHETEEE